MDQQEQKLKDHSETRGLFGIRENSSETDLSLDERFIPNPTATFFFHMKGHAMAPTIQDQDVLVVDRSLPLTHHKIAVVSYLGEFMCRRIDKRKHKLTLLADHPQYSSLLIDPSNDFIFFGHVTATVRTHWP